MTDRMTKIEYMYGHTACELCGARRTLELHHIIPRVCGGSDEPDNWLALCPGCHGKLTPKSALIKAGIRVARDQPVMDFYQALSGKTDNGGWGSEMILDTFEAIFLNNKYPVVTVYTRERNPICSERTVGA